MKHAVDGLKNTMVGEDVEFEESYEFEPFNTHKEIPVMYRRYLLDYTGERRIKNIDLRECNELIQEFIQENTTNEALKNFELSYRLTPKSPLQKKEFSGRKAWRHCFLEFDNLVLGGDNLDECDYKNSLMVVMVKQNGRFVRGLWKGQMIYPHTIYNVEVPPTL